MRPAQTNCQQEPAYPEHETVVCSIRDPMLTAHGPRRDCSIEEPHHIETCGLWAKLGEPVHINSYGVAITPGLFDFDTGQVFDG